MTTTRTALGLAGLCAFMGVAHARRPEPFDALIPPALPGPPRAWTYGSGVAEVAVAGLLAAPPTRRLGGRAAQALFVAVFPGNLQMAWDWRHRPWRHRLVALGRLPLQLVLLRLAGRVARG